MIPTNYDVTGEPLNDMKEVSYPETHNFSLVTRPEKEKGATFFMQHCFLLSSRFGEECTKEYVQVISVLPTLGNYLLKILRTLSVKNEVSFLNKELVQNSK